MRDLVRSRGLGDMYERQVRYGAAQYGTARRGTGLYGTCPLYTSDGADDLTRVVLGVVTAFYSYN